MRGFRDGEGQTCVSTLRVKVGCDGDDQSYRTQSWLAYRTSFAWGHFPVSSQEK